MLLGIGLWRLFPPARLLTMVLAGISVLLASYGLLSMLMHRVNLSWTAIFVVVLLLVDFAVIAYLSLPSAKKLFEPRAAVHPTPGHS